MSDYYHDEYYEEEAEDEPEMIVNLYLCKAANGQLYYSKVYLTRWPGQDWGECDAYESNYSLHQANKDFRRFAIALGREMESESAIDVDGWHYWEMWGSESNPLLPDDIPF